jgi:hypothetical protein
MNTYEESRSQQEVQVSSDSTSNEQQKSMCSVQTGDNILDKRACPFMKKDRT